jgi:4-hydroxybenzoate polyprenyltransferase
LQEAVKAESPAIRQGDMAIEPSPERVPRLSWPGAVFVSLRPHQWTKNLIVFAALAFSKHLFDPVSLRRSAAAFAVFCGLSGAVYLVNDVIDVERDRLHPRKRRRPVASGALKTSAAVAISATLMVLGAAAAWRLGLEFAQCAAAYVLLNLLYSFKLKNVVILDVLSISMGFVIRAAAGGLVIGVPISEWLLICTILLALFLALSKRRHELTSLSESAVEHREILSEYSPYLLDQMISVVTASCVTAYAVYTTAEETKAKFGTARLPWTIPFVLYGIFRYLYLVHHKEQGGSPSEILLTDRPLLIAVALWAAAAVWILYSVPGTVLPVTLGHGH